MNEATRHTPGEWKADGNGVHVGTRCVAVSYDPDARDSEMTEVRKANARLIAASPELLGACELALEWIQRTFQLVQLTPGLDDGLSTAKDELRAAINKALNND